MEMGELREDTVASKAEVGLAKLAPVARRAPSLRATWQLQS